MSRERGETVSALFFAIDLSVLVVSSLAAHRVRAWLDPVFPDITGYIVLFAFMVAIWALLLYSFGLYKTPRGGRFQDDFAGLLKVSAAGFFLAGAVIFGLKLHYVSRLLVGIFSMVAFSLLVVERAATRSLIARTSAAIRSVLVIGLGPQVQMIRKVLQEEERWGVRLVEPRASEVISGDPIESAAALSILLTTTVVDEVIFSVSPAELTHIEASLLVCECLGVKAHIAVAMGNLHLAKAVSNDLRGIPLLTFTTTPFDEWHLLAKRTLDVVGSAVLLTFLAPVMAAVAVAVKLTSPGPALFKQVRAGANGRPFGMYKFRSMCQDADVQQITLAGSNEMSGPVFKMRNDPRLTALGRYLRKTSVDELPQLWNVLCGHMSLVGPRPPVPSEVARYESWQRRRLSMKPGLTCLWQVSGRSEIADFEKWMKLDLEYIDSWSLALDMRILMKTLPAVLSGRGAA
jgi:exopolysaccharide biosynthesis polyprenyl glycosylphosphotransferase